jgi:Rrf2 family nitric oxide-sensitive transcriptional repressor
MRMTSFTDYSLRTLMYLASLPEGQLSSVKEVSQLYGISQNNMTKVVHKLAQHGYIQTLRGKGGGIRLAMSPDTIRIGTIVTLFEKTIDGVDCLSSGCVLQPACKLKLAIIKAMDNFICTLNEFTLADMVVDKQEISYLLQLETAKTE